MCAWRLLISAPGVLSVKSMLIATISKPSPGGSLGIMPGVHVSPGASSSGASLWNKIAIVLEPMAADHLCRQRDPVRRQITIEQ